MNRDKPIFPPTVARVKGKTRRGARHRSAPWACVGWILVLLALLGAVCVLVQWRWEALRSVLRAVGEWWQGLAACGGAGWRAGVPELPLAVAPVWFKAATGGLGLFCLWVVVCAVRKVWSNEQDAARARFVAANTARARSVRVRKVCMEHARRREAGRSARDPLDDDPLEAEFRCLIGMTDAVAILQSCTALLGEAEEKLGRPVVREGLGVENYDELLHLATQDVRSVRHCLNALLEKMQQPLSSREVAA